MTSTSSLLRTFRRSTREFGSTIHRTKLLPFLTVSNLLVTISGFPTVQTRTYRRDPPSSDLPFSDSLSYNPFYVPRIDSSWDESSTEEGPQTKVPLTTFNCHCPFGVPNVPLFDLIDFFSVYHCGLEGRPVTLSFRVRVGEW